MKSWYKSFAELNTVEKNGLAFRLQVKNRKSPCAIIAPHGGGIEPGTTELAIAIAGWSYSLYTFDGIRLSGNELLHITSTLFDEPRCLNLVQASDRVLAIHGCEGSEQIVYVGGLDVELGDQIIVSLKAAGFEAVRATTQFLGTQPENICNRGKSGRGTQLEISDGLRRSMFKSLNRSGRKEIRAPFQKFVNAIRETLQAVNMSQDL
ncbi:MAG: poly-gamma-glutamate hydrolase family protein [Chloroflexota bacterium]